MVLMVLMMSLTLSLMAPENPLLQDQIKQKRLEIEKQERDRRLKHQRITRILSTLRYVEARDDYFAKGSSNEYGAYQFTPSTWAYYSKMFFDEVLDITVPENQDRVAYKKVAMMVDLGYSDQQIAATWNYGSPTGWEKKIGVNRYGARYNVPAYVNKFMSKLETT